MADVFERMCGYLGETGRATLTSRQLRRSRRTAMRQNVRLEAWWYLLAMATNNRQGLAELKAQQARYAEAIWGGDRG